MGKVCKTENINISSLQGVNKPKINEADNVNKKIVKLSQPKVNYVPVNAIIIEDRIQEYKLTEGNETISYTLIEGKLDGVLKTNYGKRTELNEFFQNNKSTNIILLKDNKTDDQRQGYMEGDSIFVQQKGNNKFIRPDDEIRTPRSMIVILNKNLPSRKPIANPLVGMTSFKIQEGKVITKPKKSENKESFHDKIKADTTIPDPLHSNRKMRKMKVKKLDGKVITFKKNLFYRQPIAYPFDGTMTSFSIQGGKIIPNKMRLPSVSTFNTGP